MRQIRRRSQIAQGLMGAQGRVEFPPREQSLVEGCNGLLYRPPLYIAYSYLACIRNEYTYIDIPVPFPLEFYRPLPEGLGTLKGSGVTGSFPWVFRRFTL